MGILDVVFSGDFKASNFEFDDPTKTEPRAEGSIEIPAVLATTHGGDDGRHTVLSVRNLTSGATVFSSDQFIISRVSETRMFRHSPIFTFGQPQVFTPNVRAIRSYQLAGYVLLDHVSGDTRNQLWKRWDSTLRASAMLVGKERQESPHILDISYRNCLRSGYLTDFQLTPQSQTENQVDLTMSMFIVTESFSDG